MEVEVEVCSEGALTGDRQTTSHVLLTFGAVDQKGTHSRRRRSCWKPMRSAHERMPRTRGEKNG